MPDIILNDFSYLEKYKEFISRKKKAVVSMDATCKPRYAHQHGKVNKQTNKNG